MSPRRPHRHEGLGQFDAALDEVRSSMPDPSSDERPDPTVVNSLQEGPEGLAQGEQDQTSGELNVKFGSLSHIGNDHLKKGGVNQDSHFVDKSIRAAGVLDGMGGHTAGEVASGISRASILDVLASREPTSANEAKAQLKQAFGVAHKALLSNMREHPEHKGMGSTASVVKLYTDKSTGDLHVGWASIADSRIYLDHMDIAEQITTDESVPQGLINCLGVSEKFPGTINEFNTGTFRAEPGMRILICSDGATGDTQAELLSDQEVHEAIRSGTLNESLKKLDDISRKKRDDFTAILIEISEDGTVTTTEKNTANPEDNETVGEDGDSGKRRRSEKETGGQRQRRKRHAEGAGHQKTSTAVPDELPDPGEHDPHPTLGADDEWDSFDSPPLPPRDDDEDGDDDPYSNVIPITGSVKGTDSVVPPDSWHFPLPADPTDMSDLDSSLLGPDLPLTSSPDRGNFIGHDDAEPYPEEQKLALEIEALRTKLANLHNKKLWGVSGITRRKEMKAIHKEYDIKTRMLANRLLQEEFDDSATYEEVAKRKIEMLGGEARKFASARNASDLNLYGRIVRRAGDITYGTERKLSRRIVVGAILAGGALAIGAAAGPVSLAAIPVIRLVKASTAGVAGHDSQQGSLKTHNRVITRQLRKLDNKSEISDSALASEGEFGEIISAISRSDTKRKALSVGSQTLALGSVLQAAPIVRDLTSHIRMPHINSPINRGNGGGTASKVAEHGSTGGNKFSNLSTDDVRAFKNASPGVSDSTLHAIDQDPKAFDRFINSVNTIHARTGLEGNALNERVTKTLALAHEKDAYIQAAQARGIGVQTAGEAFDHKMAEMIFADTVDNIQKTTGLTGNALLNRVTDTAALAQTREQFINQVSAPAERLARQRQFDQMARQFFEHIMREESKQKVTA